MEQNQFTKKNKAPLWIVITTTIFLLTAFQNCSKVAFSSGSDSQDQAQTLPSPDGNLTYEVNTTLSATETKPLDLIWIVDNSGSMSTEAAQVRSNLEDFVLSLSSHSNLRIALISKIGNSGQAVDLADTNIPTLKINRAVGSTDALKILSSALCSPGNLDSYCQQDTDPIHGALGNFLRADSHKVVVLVTDDESALPTQTFLSVFGAAYNPSDLSVFGWIGLGASSPCQAKTGTRYMDLTQQTQGQVFNICDGDWTSHFNSLVENIVTLIKKQIILPSHVLQGEILHVSLNGQPVPAEDYRIQENKLIFSDAIYQAYNQVTLKIIYR